MCDPIDVDDLHVCIQVWLARHGFIDEQDIRALALHGPALAHACLIAAATAAGMSQGKKRNTLVPESSI